MIKSAFDRPSLFTACEDGLIRLFDSDSNKLVTTFKGHTDSVNSISLSKNGYNFVSGGHDGKVILWDYRKGTKICDFENAHYKKYDEVVHDVQ